MKVPENGEEIPQERLFSVPGAGALAEAEEEGPN